jgi:hypothetical protein
MKRKLFITGLAIVLPLCMAVPALATESAPPDSAVDTAEGAAGTPEIKLDVEVPTKAEFTLNPYHMPVETSEGRRYDTVVCLPQTFASRTAAPLLVTVTVSGAPRAGSDLLLVTSPEEFDPNAKTVFLWYEFVGVADGQEPVWSGEYTGARNQVELNDDSGAVLELPASVDGEPVLTAFRAFGMAGVPSEGLWTDVDCVDASISLHFDVIEEDDAELFGVTLPDVADEASDVEEPADEASDVVQPTIGEPPIPMDVDEASGVDVADEVSDVEEPVDVVDDVSDLVKPTIGEPPIPMDIDDASDVEETVDVADEASNVEEAVDDVDDVSDVVQPTIGEPPIPMDVDEASDAEEVVDVVDEASDVEEGVDVVDEASDVEEPVDVVDEASDVEEAVDVVDEASDVEEAVDVVDEASDVEEPVDVADEASDVEEAVDVADEASDVDEAVDVADE